MRELAVDEPASERVVHDARFAAEGGSAWRFFALTYAFSWVLWAPFILWLRSKGRLGGEAGEAPLEGLPIWIATLWFLGAWGPSIVGLALTARIGGREAVGRLLRRALDWRVGRRWHAATWIGPAFLALLAIGLYVANSGTGVTLSIARLPLIPIALILAVPFGPFGEEFGWRGYALPRLQTSSTALTSAIVLGTAWTFWHLPLFWAPLGASISGSPVTVTAVGQYFIEVVALSIRRQLLRCSE